MDEHIRIGDVAPRVQYVADGVQRDFPYNFPIFGPADLEVRLDELVQTSGFTVAGAGTSEGGRCSFATPPAAGQRVTLRRAIPVSRTTDFQENGILRARTLNDELDYQVAALQEVREELTNALRTDPSEVGGNALVPGRDVRANKLLGFDSVGSVTVYERGEGTLETPFPGGVPRTVEDKLAERLSARDFGAQGDGISDDGPALQAAMNAAAAAGKLLEIGEGLFRTTMPLIFRTAAAGLTMRGTILYDGPANRVALTIGDAGIGSARHQGRAHTGLSVVRATQSDWLNEADVGIRLVNIDACQIELRRVERFTIGLQLWSEGRGCEDSTIALGRLTDNRIGLDCRTLLDGTYAWMNSLRFIGGHFACSSATHPTLARFGVRLSAAPGAYDRHNAHLYVAPAFELQRQGTPGTVDAIPFLLEVNDGRGLRATGVRMEACSPVVARHTGAFNDAVYEVAYVGTYGFLGCGIDYPATATRAGGTVLCDHQAAAAQGSPRLVAGAEQVRARAFRQTTSVAGGVGFDQLAILSSNPNGPPTTLNGFCFGGLNLLTLNPETVGLPTSRAIAFVLDLGDCREILLAAEGTKLRPVILQFDAAETLLGQAAPVRFSNANALWNPGDNGLGEVLPGFGTAFWHEMNVDLDTLTAGFALNRLQRVRLHDSARYAAIGVRGGSAGAVLKSLRLFAAATDAPTLLYGGPRGWGVREYTASAPWTVPSLAAGANATFDLTLPGARQGDLIEAGFARDSGFQNGFLVYHAVVGGTAGTDQIRVTAQNLGPGTNPGGSGTLFVRAVKPRA